MMVKSVDPSNKCFTRLIWHSLPIHYTIHDTTSRFIGACKQITVEVSNYQKELSIGKNLQIPIHKILNKSGERTVRSSIGDTQQE